jgi:ABC-type uncharacterized transport system substrate-binding protein
LFARRFKRPFAATSGLAWAALMLCAGPSASVLGSEPEDDRVVVVAGHQSSYRQAARALVETLRDADADVLLLQLASDDEGDSAKVVAQLRNAQPRLIATAGGTATVLVLDHVPGVPTATVLVLDHVPGVPVVPFMVPNLLDASFAVPDSRFHSRVAAVAADVSPVDRIKRIRQLHPGCRKLGVLYSPRTTRTIEAITTAAASFGMVVVPIQADASQFPEAIAALNQEACDAALMIPDARVYNAANVQRLLLWGLRQKKPVWAFSASVVKAGAAGGQYVEPEAVGREAARLVQRILRGQAPNTFG